LLTHGRLDPTVLIGGIALNFDGGSSYRIGSGRDFVSEGDEYDSAFFDKTAKFLKYLPDVAVINNVEFDHADIYADLDAVLLAFRAPVQPGAAQWPAAARRGQPACGGPRTARGQPVETFGTADSAGLAGDGHRIGRGPDAFQAAPPRRAVRALRIALLGVHNVRNAVAAIAVGSHVG